MTQVVNRLTDLLKVTDHTIVNETIIALQGIINDERGAMQDE